MKLIPLSRGLFAQVDDHWYDYLNQWKWTAQKGHKTFYAVRQVHLSDGKQKSFRMHRIILGLTDSGTYGEHADGNGLNNLTSNLRASTDQENKFNRGINKNNNTGFKGVTINQNRKKKPFRAMIRHNKKLLYLGAYKSAVEAALAYNNKASELYGNFARLNIL